MKKIVRSLLIIILLTTCKSAEKLVTQGNYDAAIDKVVKKMVKGKAKSDDKILLDKAFALANQRDRERIDFLLAEGKEENWDQIYRTYQRLRVRQEKIQRVAPFKVNNKTFEYEYIDYNQQIAEAKKNAADFFYIKGKEQMELGTKEHYRQAYSNFSKAKNYRAEAYPDIDELLMDARYLGTSRVLIELDNPNNLRFPPDFFDRILGLNPRNLNTDWVEYYTGGYNQDIEFDYYAVLVLIGADIIDNEEQVDSYRREKTIEEVEYQKDRRGNVMKDSLGNDIKIIRERKLSAVVNVISRTRTATLYGEIEYYTARPERIIDKRPISATSVFENIYANARGDRGALTHEDMELSHNPVLPYPDELSMLYDCAEIMRERFEEALRSNRRLMP